MKRSAHPEAYDYMIGKGWSPKRLAELTESRIVSAYKSGKQMDDKRKNEKELLIQEWKKDGVDKELLDGYIAYMTERSESLHRQQIVSLWIPVTHESSKVKGRLIKFPVFPEDTDKDPDELLEMCFNSINQYMNDCDIDIWYLKESVKYNLPAWNEDILPNEILKHIFENHTLNGRIGYLLQLCEDDITAQFYLSYIDFVDIQLGLPKCLESGASLDKTDEKILRLVLEKEKKDHFPRHMSEDQIKISIKAAYENARKIGGRRIPNKRDRINAGGQDRGHILYQGKTRDVVIHFWFDFEENIITTAYPVYSK